MAKRRSQRRFDRRQWLRAVKASNVPPEGQQLARYLAQVADHNGQVVIVEDTARAEQ